MPEATIENGAAKVPAGKWLAGRLQPVAARGSSSSRGLRGFIVPDRAAVCELTTTGESWCSEAKRPFLTRLTALPDTSLCLVSSKILVAPFESRVGARSVKLVPMSFRRTTTVTELRFGWAVAATESRVSQVSLADGETLVVRPEALVAWIGKDPTGFCPRLSVWDMILPRNPRGLSFSFHGPCTVWFEGASRPARRHKLFNPSTL